ncbi:MAG: HAD hydrolase-like protein, partial [Anaerolineae bacterium]
ALDLAGCKPAEAVYVGDNYYADVVGAQRAGLPAVLIDQYGVYEHIADRCIVLPHAQAILNEFGLSC